VTTYILAIRKFGEDELYDALKEHYSDVCSNGDVVINDIINMLNEGRRNSPYLLIQKLRTIEDVETYLYHPELIMKQWMEEGECTPDAFWAS
jgi:hypothetical protein